MRWYGGTEEERDALAMSWLMVLISEVKGRGRVPEAE